VYVSLSEVSEFKALTHVAHRQRVLLAIFFSVLIVPAIAQTDCNTGTDILDTAEPKGTTPQELIQKFTAAENKVLEVRRQYTFTQDLLVQTLEGTSVDGQFHQITEVSYDDKGKRIEKVSFSEQPTLRGLQLTPVDVDDVRQFMQWILTTDEAAQYNLTYAGRQHVDDLDTYVFHVEAKKIEKDRRYFQGRVWVDDRDLQVVKLCGKSVPDIVAKKHKPADVRPTFVAYRQFIDSTWLPAYARVDEKLDVGVDSVHIREIVKFNGYKRIANRNSASAR
jgi:hypothetical protein